MAESFAGAGVALVTPVHARGRASTRPRCGGWCGARSRAASTCSCPAAPPARARTMTEDEQQRVIAITLEERGGSAGAGGRGQQRHAHGGREDASAPGRPGRARASSRSGPYYNKPTPEGFFRHFSAIADASPVPVVVYNVPGRTGSNIDAKTLLRLAAHPNIAAVKEASGNLGQVMEILRDRPEGFEVLSGRRRLHAGLHGAGRRRASSRSPPTRCPARCTTLTAACARGDFAAARAHPQPAAAAHEPQLRRVEPDPGEGLARAAWACARRASACRMCPPDRGHARGAARGAARAGAALVSAAGGLRRASIEALLRAARGGAGRRGARASSTSCCDALESRRGARGGARPRRLAGQRLGEEGHPARLPPGPGRGDGARGPAALLRQGHASCPGG